MMDRYRLDLLAAYGQVRALLDAEAIPAKEYQKPILETFDLLEETIARAKREYQTRVVGR